MRSSGDHQSFFMTGRRASRIVEAAATSRRRPRTERTRHDPNRGPHCRQRCQHRGTPGARQALTDAPEAAQFQWRARCEWVNGTHSRSIITDFSGLGDEHSHRQTYTIEADHPEVFASEDNGVTPPEIVLGALASCLTAGVATVATNRGVQLRSVSVTVQGEMDLQGILGIDADVRKASTVSTFGSTSTRTRARPTSRPSWRSPRSVPPSSTSSPTRRPCRFRWPEPRGTRRSA